MENISARIAHYLEKLKHWVLQLAVKLDPQVSFPEATCQT